MKPKRPATKAVFFITHRYSIVFIFALLFLPPLSFLFQFTGESNFCGTWCPRMFFVWRENMTLSTYFAGFMRAYMGVILVAGILITSFFLGRIWCSHMCPIGGIMELGSSLVPRFLKIDFSKIPAPAFRYGYLTVYFGAAAFGIGSLCCSYCNFGVIPRMMGAAFSSADLAYFLRTAGLINLGLVIALGFCAKGGRAYCNFLCPIGALDSMVNTFGAPFGRRFSIDPSRCSSCGQCAAVCPVWAINAEDKNISALSCIPCGKCAAVCPARAISYGKSKQATAYAIDEIIDGSA